MVVFHFGLEDLARTRFAISPMWELVISLRLLRDASRAGLHLAWIEAVRPELPGLDLASALSLLPPEGYIPDFLSPPPSGPLADIAGELDQLRSTSAWSRAWTRGQCGSSVRAQ